MSSLNNTPEYSTSLSIEEFEHLYSNKDKITQEQKTEACLYVLNTFNQINKFKPQNISMEDSLSEMSSKCLDSLFWGLTHCNCCWRHLHNTPIALDSQENSNVLDVATIEMTKKDNCGCHCRMAKRFLRRAYFSEKHIPEDLPYLDKI